MDQSSPQLTTIKIAQAKNFEDNQIKNLMQDLLNAIRLKDVPRILSCYDDDAVIYDVRDTLQKNKDDLRKAWHECFDTSTDFSVEALDLQVEVSQNCAYAYGFMHSTGVAAEGEKIDIWMRATHIFRKIDEKWLIIHEHMSLPGNFVTGEVLQKLKPKTLN